MIEIRTSPLHSGQRRVRAAKRRFNILCCGRRWGKTHFGLDELVMEPRGALDGYPVAWFAPYYKMLLEPWREAKRLLAPAIRKGGISELEKRIELVTGGSIDFWSLSDPDSARGRKYAKIVVDEAAMVRKLRDAWQMSIRPTLTDYRGGAWFLTTPKGRNDFGKMFDEVPNNPAWQRFQRPTSDNPYIDPEEIAAARAELPALVFAQEYLAQFVDMAGSAIKREWIEYGDPFARWKRDQLVITIGVDLAISLRESSDFTALVVVALDPEGGVWILDAYRARVTFRGAIELIVGMADKWRPNAVAVEEVQYQAAVVDELLRTTPLNVRGIRPEKDKLTRLQPLQARYERHMVKHSESLPPYFEGELLSFPPGRGGDHDDLVDATVYAFMQACALGFGETIAHAGDRIATAGAAIEDSDGWGTVSVHRGGGF